MLVAGVPWCGSAGIRVLFIGNSYIYVNDLPGTVAAIAQSLGDHVDYEVAASGGYRLMQHVQDGETAVKIRSRPWDFVVLQEQSQVPAFSDSQVDREMVPYAVQLDHLIHTAHAATRTLFFATWGWVPEILAPVFRKLWHRDHPEARWYRVSSASFDLTGHRE